MDRTLQRNISVDITKIKPATDKSIPPRLCVVGIVPFESPVIGHHHPQMTIRSTKFEERLPYVEQIRFSSIAQQGLLPSIAYRAPSKLRDSLKSLMALGLSEVDYILARAPGVLPWDLNHPEIAQMFISYLAGVQGAVIVFPDAGGPWPRAFGDLRYIDDRQKNLRQCVQYFSSILADNYQIGLMDFVQPKSDLKQYIWSLQGADIGLCTWSGSHHNLARHGWRSAAASIGGFITNRHDLFSESIVGHYLPLGEGRHITPDRSTLLGAPTEADIDPVMLEHCINMQVHARKDIAQVLSDPINRRPIGEWSIATVRLVKAIHQSLRRAADLFVFRPVKNIEAITFKTAIQMALAPFYNEGLLNGPGGSGEPEISTEALPDRDVPMLSADLAAQIQPWCRHISLKVVIKSGQQPIIQES